MYRLLKSLTVKRCRACIQSKMHQNHKARCLGWSSEDRPTLLISVILAKVNFMEPSDVSQIQ